MESYENLLNDAYKNVKVIEGSGERFELPKIEGRFEGKRTVLTNFCQISSHIRRNMEHFQKFLLKSLAVSGNLESDRLILNKKIPSAKINEKIQDYAKEFVICRECQKPDTELIKEGKNSFINCLACGARHSVRSKI